MEQEQNDNSINWSKLQQQPFQVSIDPEMLSEGGFRRYQAVRLIGQSKFTSEMGVVIYDRNYVVHWIAKRLLKHLKPRNYNELQSLISEAYKIWKEGE